MYYSGTSNDLGARLADVNGDGLTDFLYGAGGGSNCDRRVYLNNGTGWEQTTTQWRLPHCFVDAYLDNGARVEDVNGDGLPDFLRGAGVSGGACSQYSGHINNGTDWIQDDSWKPPYCFSENGNDVGSRMTDFNGDGLVDFIHAQADGSGCGLGRRDPYINNGSGWVYDARWRTPDCFAYTYTDVGYRIADVNGDGLSDILRGWTSGGGTCQKYSYINNATKGFLLDNVTTGFGGVIKIDYGKSTYLSNKGSDEHNDLGFNVWVVSNITYKNNIIGPHNQTYIYSYNYSNGLYNNTINEFRGFGYVEERTDNKLVKHYFHQTNSLKGRQFKTEVLNLDSITYQIVQKRWSESRDGSKTTVSLVGESDLIYDGNNSATPKTSNKTYDYDSFGNNIYTHTKGNNDDASDDYYEYMAYVNNSASWIVHTIQNYTLIDSDNSTRLRQTNYSYDGLSYGSAPTKGSVTFKEELLFGSVSKNISFQYGSFGNVENQTDSRGNKIKYSYGDADPSNTFADSATDAKGFKTTYGYELGSGNMRNQTSPNHFFSNFTYDFLNIDKQTVLPLDNINFPTQEYAYTFQTVGDSKIIVKQREQNGTSNTLDTYKFYDGFGRIIQSKTDATDNKQIVVDYYYDNSGKISRQSNPYLITSTPNYTSANTSVPFTLYQYDSLGRVIKVFNPDNTFKTISFDRWNITLYDENSHRTGYELDSKGRISRVIEYNGSASYSTSYQYNAVGELILINDSLSNAFNFTYDSLGRKVKERDPDRGIWNYSYDTQGNLIKQFDNRNISLSFVYDSLNRKLNESSGNNWVKYIYDSDLNNTMSDIVTNVTVTNYSYDNRLRKVREDKNISNKKYSNSWIYDSADRVTHQIMPDGRMINFTYNEQGLLSNISRIVNISYNENNNPLEIIYANSLVTDYTYNSSNLRLITIDTADKQELNYEYDAVGNVLVIDDNIHNAIYTMTYDNLNRLTSTNIGGSFNILLGFIYDQIGNIRNVTGSYPTDYYYQDSRPHATSRFNLLINTSQVINDTNKFLIQNSSAYTVAWLGDFGNIALMGTCSVSSNCVAPSGSLVFGNSTDNSTAYIDMSGNLCLESGSCSDGASSCNPTTDSFIMQNTTGYNMSYISFNGNLCLTGGLYENVAL